MCEIILFKNKEECSGCGACFATCPCSAITMVEDEFGCKYPTIDTQLCIQCKKCLKVCDYQQVQLKDRPIAAFAAKAKNKKIERKSTSGGIFATLAYEVLSQGGRVAGAVLDIQRDGRIAVYHMLSENDSCIERMQGSKYVQSDAWKIYKDIAFAVKRGQMVLFCGTPCQVAAIKRITNNPFNLITIDLICHGVPTAKMLEEFLQIMSKTLYGRIVDLCFRDKTLHKDWSSKITVIRGKKERSYYIHSQYISFYKYFLESVIYRENCYTCPYARLERISDLTIGDFWGIEEIHKDEIGKDTNNWSCVLINTEKGKDFFENYGLNVQKIVSKEEWIARFNQQLVCPSKKNGEREDILKNYRIGGYWKIENEFRKSKGGEILYRYRLFKEIYNHKRQR